MIRNIQLIILSVAVVLGMTSCLDKYPEDGIPSDGALQTVTDVDQAVLGIYAGFKSSSLYSGTMTTASELQSDLFYAVEGYTNTYGDFWRWEILPNSRDVEAVYNGLYNIIGRCNFVFDNIDRVRANTVDDNKLDQLDELLGETYFARALAYSELIKVFCKPYEPETAAQTLGVVLSDSYGRPSPKKRASLEASYKFILDDLEKAEELLSEDRIRKGLYYDYFNLSTVNALYARVYLYMQNWEEAVKYSTMVIEDDAFELASVNRVSVGTSQSEYLYMWSNDMSPEIIWRVNFSLSSYGGALGRVFLNYDYVSFTPDYVPGEWMLNLYDMDKDRRFRSFFSYATTGHTHRLEWYLLVKFLGNDNFIKNGIFQVNMPKVFRLSEQYLIRAEAYCNLEKYTLAANDITRLRTRRYTTYGTASVNANNWLDVISEERVRELCMEGFRLNDLKRWHKGFERKPQLSTIEGSNANKLKVEADDPLFVWPIPQHELDVPGSQIEPNESNK